VHTQFSLANSYPLHCFSSFIVHQHPGEGVAAVARALGLIWGTMTDEEKLPYQQKAAAEREQVVAATEAWKAAGGVVPEATASSSNNKTDGSLVLPAARIRKICKLDPDVRGLSKEALLLITKAAELATAKLGLECVKTAQIQNRRKLLPEDVAQVISAREQFLFLREDIQDLHRQQQKEAAANNKSTTTKTKSKENTAAAKNSKPLTDYFKAA
jgi:DNA-directed RNA polymerase I subunit RPA43